MLRSRLVLFLSAALAYGSELVEPLPDIFHLYIVDPLTAEMRNYVQAAEHLVFLLGLGREVRFHDLCQLTGDAAQGDQAAR
jgi:hypothetical protein